MCLARLIAALENKKRPPNFEWSELIFLSFCLRNLSLADIIHIVIFPNPICHIFPKWTCNITTIIKFKDGNEIKIILHTYYEFEVSNWDKLMYGNDGVELKKSLLFVTDYYVTIKNKNTNFNKKYFYRDERYGDSNVKKN